MTSRQKHSVTSSLRAGLGLLFVVWLLTLVTTCAQR
jgi:hypothetical protein